MRLSSSAALLATISLVRADNCAVSDSIILPSNSVTVQPDGWNAFSKACVHAGGITSGFSGLTCLSANPIYHLHVTNAIIIDFKLACTHVGGKVSGLDCLSANPIYHLHVTNAITIDFKLACTLAFGKVSGLDCISTNPIYHLHVTSAYPDEFEMACAHVSGKVSGLD